MKYEVQLEFKTNKDLSENDLWEIKHEIINCFQNNIENNYDVKYEDCCLNEIQKLDIYENILTLDNY